jgi:hypothetical protein
MSRNIDRAPFAVTSDGNLLLNVAMFDGKRLKALFELAARERGAVFVGVVLGRAERIFLDQRTGDAAHDAAAWLVGARLRRRKRAPRQGQRRRAASK